MRKPGRNIDPGIYVRVLDNVEDAIIAVDQKGRVALFNPAAQLYTGLSERQSLGKEFEELFAGQQGLLYLIRTAIREGRSISDRENLLLRRNSGTPLPVSASVSPIYDTSGEREGVVIILRDLSRVRELENAVRRADRLTMLGTLAAGLAHEIKNPLGGIKGTAQLLSMELKEGPLKEYTEIMTREVERINGIIEGFMDLARPRPPQLSEVNLAKILGNIVLFQKEAHRGKEIDFQLHLDPSIPPIRGDENLLTQLFLNLVKNACEAIRKKGRVDVGTKVVSEYHMHTPGDRSSPLIAVEIRDTGDGIDPEEIDRIFTPFYTTKTRGSGLGLATCQKIVHDHMGFLKVESVPGQGTIFIIYLPFIR